MAAKLALILLVLTMIIAAVMIAVFLYLKETAELKHEQEMKEMEQTERLWDEE